MLLVLIDCQLTYRALHFPFRCGLFMQVLIVFNQCPGAYDIDPCLLILGQHIVLGVCLPEEILLLVSLTFRAGDD